MRIAELKSRLICIKLWTPSFNIQPQIFYQLERVESDNHFLNTKFIDPFSPGAWTYEKNSVHGIWGRNYYYNSKLNEKSDYIYIERGGGGGIDLQIQKIWVKYLNTFWNKHVINREKLRDGIKRRKLRIMGEKNWSGITSKKWRCREKIMVNLSYKK